MRLRVCRAGNPADMGVKPSKDGADTARVTAHEDHQSTALVTAAADEALLRAAIGADADGLLLGAVRSGLGAPGLAELGRVSQVEREPHVMIAEWVVTRN